MYRYSTANPSWQIRGIVRAAAAIACDKLQLVDVPKIHFIKADSAGNLSQTDDCGGWCTNKPEIYLRVDLAPKEIISVLFHELLHVDEFLSGLIYKDLDSSERRARLFALDESEVLPDDPAKLLAQLESRQRLIAARQKDELLEHDQAAAKVQEFLASYNRTSGGDHGKLLGGSR
jgi:hypothetical protein